MACYSHTEATHPGLKRKRSFTDREFDVDECGSGSQIAATGWAGGAGTFICCPTETCSEHRHERDIHNDAILISVDGACRGNGHPWARAGAGVYFRRDNRRWNRAVVLGDEYKTSQRAELYAGWLALSLASQIRQNNPVGVKRLRVPAGPTRKLRRVVIQADSEYLVKGMTDWIYKWRQNGYRNCRGLPVTNAYMFKKLDDVIDDLNDMDVEVQFWHVPREQNKIADHLANAALDGVDVQDAVERFFDDGSDSDSDWD